MCDKNKIMIGVRFLKPFDYRLLLLHIGLLGLALLFPSPLFGYIITGIILVTSYFYVKNGWLFLLVFFPLRPFLTEVNGGLLYLGDLIIILLFFMTLIFARPSIEQLRRNYLFTIFFILMLGVGFFSGLFTGISLVAGIFQVRAFLIMFLLIYIASAFPWEKRDIKAAISVSLAVATLLSVHGLIEKISLRHWLLPETWENWNLASANAMRIYGLIGNPNVLATYLIIVFFMSFYLKPDMIRWYKLLPFLRIVILGAFLLTYSRGTILAFGFGFLVFLFFQKKWRSIVPVFIYGIVAFALIYYPVVTAVDYIQESGFFQQESNQPETSEIKKTTEESATSKTKKQNNVFIERFQEMFSSATLQSSLEWGRLYVVFKGIEIFLDHPFIGTGFATYGDSATKSYPSPIYEEYGVPDNLYTDNQYIEILVETGIVGTLLFLTFLAFLIGKLFRYPNSLMRNLGLAMTAAMLVAGLFYNILEDKTFTLYYYLLIGYIISINSHKKLET